MVQDADNNLENDYDAAYTYLLEHAEMSEELPSLRNQNGSKAKAKDNSSIGASEFEKQSKAVFKSYKSIYEEYAKKLEKEYNNAVKELEDAIKAKKGVDYLAEMTDKKIELFAEICDEGIEIMADKTSVFTTDDYFEWATKLTGDYMSYSTSLYGKYMSGAMDNIFD